MPNFEQQFPWKKNEDKRQAGPNEVVGNFTEEDKQELLSMYAESFQNQGFEEIQDINGVFDDKLKNVEKEKTPEELEVIDLANKKTNAILEECGMDPFDIPAENVHIAKEEEWEKLSSGATGFYDPRHQAIILQGGLPKLVLADVLIHELLHIKTTQVLRIKRIKGEDEEVKVFSERNFGLNVDYENKDKGWQRVFALWTEATTEELAKRAINEVEGREVFEDEVRIKEDIRLVLPDARRNSSEESLWDDDNIITVEGEIIEEGDRYSYKMTEIFSFAYPQERQLLNTLIDKLYEKNQDKFEDREEVFNLFAKSMLSADTRELGRLVNDTFGEGTTRKFIELDKDPEALKEFVEGL